MFNVSDWGNPSSPGWPGPEDSETLPEQCYFKGYRDPGPVYGISETWYHILGAKLLFVLIFEVRHDLEWFHNSMF